MVGRGDLLMTYKDESMNYRLQMIEEIKAYCKELDMELPQRFPDGMSNEEMEKWIETWDEYDPFPELN